MNRSLASLLVSLSACSSADSPGRQAEGPALEAAEAPGPPAPAIETSPPLQATTPLSAPRPQMSAFCVPGPDADNDGFTEAEGDCNDCSEQINPGAYDFPDNGFDEDCSGADALAAEAVCDSGLAIDSGSPEDAARAIGLCRFVTEESRQWGVISASFTGANGDALRVDPKIAAGMLSAFGVVGPREGSALLGLSSGTARGVDQPGYASVCNSQVDRGVPGTPPEGYPKDSTSCPPGLFDDFLDRVTNLLGGGRGPRIFDDVGLELRVRVPTNTGGISFESMFFSAEYPQYICTAYNDFFVVLMDPPPSTVGDGNIVFDGNGDPIGVNNSLLAVCEPGTHRRKTFACEQGTALLEGTGFGDNRCNPAASGGPGTAGASTGWLGTRAPVDRGSIVRLRFALWDTSDPLLNSTVLIDNFRWDPESPIVTETVPVLR